MSYVIVVEPGTEKCRDFFNFISSDQNRVTRAWPDNFGLAEAKMAGIDDISYGWYVDDLQRAQSIQRIEGQDSAAGHPRYRITFNQMQSSTPHVIEAISRVQNRAGHSHIFGAYYERNDGQAVPLCARKPPVAFENDSLS